MIYVLRRIFVSSPLTLQSLAPLNVAPHFTIELTPFGYMRFTPNIIPFNTTYIVSRYQN
jgi:hypothetical protein